MQSFDTNNFYSNSDNNLISLTIYVAFEAIQYRMFWPMKYDIHSFFAISTDHKDKRHSSIKS